MDGDDDIPYLCCMRLGNHILPCLLIPLDYSPLKACHADGDVNLSRPLGIAFEYAGSDSEHEFNHDDWYD